MGIETVAVYSDVDRNAPHVSAADYAIHLGPAPARDSYLDIGKIIDAAKTVGADAIHPGYGFLSENSDFAAAVDAAGLIFIGPSADVIRAMGSKSTAKRLMKKAGVPLVPGYFGRRQDTDTLTEAANDIGYPLMVKASAGGGGKGMRLVEAASDFEDAVSAARREAQSAFGDDRLILEKFLKNARHIEVQVFGDRDGAVVHLFERDCSVQRRHQKVIEEAPAPKLSPFMRKTMGECAVNAAKAIGYVGAGTVEFLLAGGEFYFIEMNTRLQVEHPVTESVTGLDLVEWQLRLASGELLVLEQSDIALHGHAIEARVYAEDPDSDFLPQSGRLSRVVFPKGEGVRVDTGVAPGNDVSVHYDPMLAKVVAYGETREIAISRLHGALIRTELVGIKTNVDFLIELTSNKTFRASRVDTFWLDRRKKPKNGWSRLRPAEPIVIVAVAVSALRQHRLRAHLLAERSGDACSPWHICDAWRLNAPACHLYRIVDRGDSNRCHTVTLYEGRTGELDGHVENWQGHILEDQDAIEVDGQRVPLPTVDDMGRAHVFADKARYELELAKTSDTVSADEHDETDGWLAAPMPGRVTALYAAPGDTVSKGQPLLVIEAMKMEHPVKASGKGRVGELRCALGDQIKEGEPLVLVSSET